MALRRRTKFVPIRCIHSYMLITYRTQLIQIAPHRQVHHSFSQHFSLASLVSSLQRYSLCLLSPPLVQMPVPPLVLSRPEGPPCEWLRSHSRRAPAQLMCSCADRQHVRVAIRVPYCCRGDG
jgi:hypothetical protein